MLTRKSTFYLWTFRLNIDWTATLCLFGDCVNTYKIQKCDHEIINYDMLRTLSYRFGNKLKFLAVYSVGTLNLKKVRVGFFTINTTHLFSIYLLNRIRPSICPVSLYRIFTENFKNELKAVESHCLFLNSSPSTWLQWSFYVIYFWSTSACLANATALKYFCLQFPIYRNIYWILLNSMLMESILLKASQD